MAATVRCPRCCRTLPEDAFHRDRTRSTGRCSHCRDCKAGRIGPGPTGLVLVPSFPAPPPEPDPPIAPTVTAAPARATYGSVVEAWITALDPPATVHDGVLVHGLRRMAAIADDPFTTPANESKAIANMTRLQRELLGTRASKAAQGQPVAPAGGSKLDAFRNAL